MVDNAAAMGIPQKGDILVMCHRVGDTTRSAASVYDSPLRVRTFTKKVATPKLTHVV
jgi:hypothetical protein